jgi:hypothetical protein
MSGLETCSPAQIGDEIISKLQIEAKGSLVLPVEWQIIADRFLNTQ